MESALKITVIWPEEGVPYFLTHCSICDSPIEQPRTGRRRRTCSDACRQKLCRHWVHVMNPEAKKWRRDRRRAGFILARIERRYGRLDETPRYGPYSVRDLVHFNLYRHYRLDHCRTCGKPVMNDSNTGLGRLHCSRECKNAYCRRWKYMRRATHVKYYRRKYPAPEIDLRRYDEVLGVCEHCHIPFALAAFGQPQKYCSKKCRQAAYYKRHHGRVVAWRNCLKCGRRYGARSPNQNFCAPSCRYVYNSRKSRASKQLKTHRSETCLVCGEPVPPDAPNGGPRRRYCSERCTFAAYRQRRKYKREMADVRHCGWCGTALDWRTYQRVRYCSEPCRRHMRAQQARDRRNAARFVTRVLDPNVENGEPVELILPPIPIPAGLLQKIPVERQMETVEVNTGSKT